jgi:hypothetical protein
MKINPVSLCLGVTTSYLSLEYALRELYGDEIPDAGDFSIRTKAKMGGIWDMWDVAMGKRLDRSGADYTTITPEALVFSAARRSNGRRIVFAFSKTLSGELEHMGKVQRKPEDFPEHELDRLKKALITKLLTRRSKEDFGYFEVMRKNY